ncbi:hypothetical protein EYF80_062598 [Liparis tanakae]|uniref:Uncharacterized protein n=1 Tax=Liparis tanakae TaxID=230148 RepID=A0A4Z2EEQ0_9TELE|nr:hypothetical protein EYF80_062598 [Liparis tanakae]
MNMKHSPSVFQTFRRFLEDAPESRPCP